ncbi:MAG: DUF2203 domain-containing protein [Ardenticatenales bacterium]|nr:DUF2203 domain-containing protein [Ardenticatenales bacterium]
MPKYYTVEEANVALPRLEALVTELLATHNRIMAMRPEIEGVLAKSHANSGSAAASRMVLDFGRVETILSKINKMGVEVKDASTGLCDFTALHQGREIYLCWRFGEPRVEWWHELHTGFGGRRHVDELV